MRLVRALIAPKEGNTDAQYEDAWSVGERRVAVCDGASAAIYARQWAQLLAEDFAGGDPVPDTDDGFWSRVGTLGETWRAQVGGGAAPRSWYAEEKLPQGSAASLLVLQWSDGRWQGLSVGDVCCFVVVGEKFRTAFPLTRSRHFSDRPPLVTTTPAAAKTRPKVIRYAEALDPQARVFLGTDAISHWFLSEFERKRKPWLELPEADSFPAWVTERREKGTLKNDDVTLIELVP